MMTVEDDLSGIPANPNAATAPTDGRMYPPDDRFEIVSAHPSVRIFKQLRHRICIGTNGSLRIVRSDGVIEIDLRGADGRTVADLFVEGRHETH